MARCRGCRSGWAGGVEGAELDAGGGRISKHPSSCVGLQLCLREIEARDGAGEVCGPGRGWYWGKARRSLSCPCLGPLGGASQDIPRPSADLTSWSLHRRA